MSKMDDLIIEGENHLRQGGSVETLAPLAKQLFAAETDPRLDDEQWNYPTATVAEKFPDGHGPDWESSGDLVDDRPVMLSCGQLCYADTGEVIRRRTICR